MLSIKLEPSSGNLPQNTNKY